MNNVRIRYTIMLSASDFPYERVLSIAAPLLGKYFAGASCYPIDGVWSCDGEFFKESYEDSKIEPGMKILVSVADNKAEKALIEIHLIMKQIKKHCLPTLKWIHIESVKVNAHHFKIEE